MQILHWLAAIIVLAAFVCGPGGSEERVNAAARAFDRQLHETLGVLRSMLPYRGPGAA